jgi:hypothetical protein
MMIPRQRSSLLCALVAGLLSVAAGSWADERQPDQQAAPKDARPQPGDLEESPSLMRGPVPIRAPRSTPLPVAGKGRLTMAFDGNRRWCTFPDDRLQESPIKTPSGPQGRREIYTFGYQFSIAAVEPARPDTTHLLYSSPEITTASPRQAVKLGRGTTPGRSGSSNPIAVPDHQRPPDPRGRETPATLVPYWDEAQRCATVEERFDFDLDPGRYDLYISFDIRIRSGAWVQRSYAFLTGVDIREESRTLIEGVIDMRGGGRRELQLRSAAIEPLAEKGAARR